MLLQKEQKDKGIEVITPADDPTQFDPSWRSRIAHFLSNNPEFKIPALYSEYRKDEYIRKHVEFLDNVKKGKISRTEAGVAHRLAERWHTTSLSTGTKFRLEPLLLTSASSKTIADVLSGGSLDDSPFVIYEKLFFNIRDDNGVLSRSCHLRSYFALPEHPVLRANATPEELWKVTALQHGYTGLCRLWVWNDAPDSKEFDESYISQESWRSAQASMLERLVSGKLKDFDLINWLGKFTENERLRLDAKGDDSEAGKMAKLLARVLGAAAPKVLEVSSTVDEQQAINARLEEKRLQLASSEGASAVAENGELVKVSETGDFDAIMQQRMGSK